MRIRKSEERGSHSSDWLEAKHSFSFSTYMDPEWMQFGGLRVLNEDRISAGSGFPMHPHNDMEIITIMLSGELRHRDSMGHEKSIRAGEVQAMTAGKGIMHSEWNPSQETAHLFQMWIRPEREGLAPAYDQFKPEEGKIQTLASGHGAGLKINAAAEVQRVRLNKGEEYFSEKHLKTYLHLVKGLLSAGINELRPGDAALLDAEKVKFTAAKESEVIIVKMD